MLISHRAKHLKDPLTLGLHLIQVPLEILSTESAQKARRSPLLGVVRPRQSQHRATQAWAHHADGVGTRTPQGWSVWVQWVLPRKGLLPLHVSVHSVLTAGGSRNQGSFPAGLFPTPVPPRCPSAGTAPSLLAQGLCPGGSKTT